MGRCPQNISSCHKCQLDFCRFFSEVMVLKTLCMSGEKVQIIFSPNKLNANITHGKASSKITFPLKTHEILHSKTSSPSRATQAQPFNNGLTFHLFAFPSKDTKATPSLWILQKFKGSSHLIVPKLPVSNKHFIRYPRISMTYQFSVWSKEF